MPERDWVWHGTAGHFIGAPSCCFRLHTTVGEKDDPSRIADRQRAARWYAEKKRQAA